MPDNDCYGCVNRKVGCHATCEQYKKYRMELNERRRKIKERKRLDSLHRR